MPKQNNMLLMEIARHFGMSVSQFAEFMGYSRQALYQVAADNGHLQMKRLAVAQYKLEEKNEALRKAAIIVAEEQFKKRQQLIESLVDRLSV